MQTRLIMGLALAGGLALIGAWAWLSRPEGPDARPLVYVEDPDEVGTLVALRPPGIMTSENFVGHRIRIVEGAIQNIGTETLGSVELLLTFRSVEGETVLESREEGLPEPLAPGEERRYVFRFENLPAEWDYRVPEVSVLRAGYESP